MKTLYCFSLLLMLFVLLLSGCGGGSRGSTEPRILPPPQANLTDTLDDYLDTYQNDDQPGLSILVRKNGKMVYMESKGLANNNTGAAINNKTGFRIGSVTKPIVALAVMQLVEQGILNLQDTLSQHISSVSQAYGEITLFQLLTHQSGIPDYINDNDVPEITHNMTTEQFIELGVSTNESDLEFLPGTSSQYSNTGYVILAEVIQRVTGQKFTDYMQLEFYDRLNMQESYIISQDREMGDRGEDVALSHAKTTDVYAIGRENQTFNALIYGSSGQVSSIEDMNKFLEALASGDIVSTETLASMIVPQSALTDIGDYGLGWLTGSGEYWHNGKYTSESDYWHSGGYGGYRSLLSISPQHGIEVVVLTNGGDTTQEHTWNILELVRQHYL